ncbi:glycosyltransferase family 1 protein [Propioniciclava sp.]|uniref:glycosyltransferase family 4 protein n=1 Tax=Propioniciclava sp. TaxID=2038686 RepID=UPI002626DDDE|nr:glycosyltransferase family 1 protein [Propioniciclava sp.]
MGESLRVAVVAESFLPHMNGVTNSVVRLLAHLRETGHEALVLAPAMRGVPDEVEGFRVLALPSMPFPGYGGVRISLTPDFVLHPHLAAFAPDVVHLAGPLVLGWEALQAAGALGVPSVAVYQTEVTAYAAQYGFPQLESLLWRRLRNIHTKAQRTLVPSTFSASLLARHGVTRLHRWGRGVDTVRFSPGHRSDLWRRAVAARGETIVGYVGRLAPEKQVDALAAVGDLPGVRLVIAGDGPLEPALRDLLPSALFLGHLSGGRLGEVMASLDIFVHTGEFETFGQTLQEAHASGVPVVAPRRGGPVDLVDHGVDGLLYAPGDREDLRRCVGRLLASPETTAAMGAAGRAKVRDRTWTTVCDEVVDHYRAVIAERVLERAGRVRQEMRA